MLTPSHRQAWRGTVRLGQKRRVLQFEGQRGVRRACPLRELLFLSKKKNATLCPVLANTPPAFVSHVIADAPIKEKKEKKGKEKRKKKKKRVKQQEKEQKKENRENKRKERKENQEKEASTSETAPKIDFC